MFVYVGSYTSADRNGRGTGITVYRAEQLATAWERVQTVATIDNPSLLRMGPDGRMLYAVHGARTSLSAFAIDPVDGRLVPQGSAQSGGLNPVDLAFLPGGRFLVTANYTSGTVAMLPVDEDGTLQQACQTITLARPSYGSGEPEATLPHGVTIDPSGRFVLIPAKGLDCVFVFRFDPSGRLMPAAAPYAACSAGSGPRHAVFHPELPFLYVVSELACIIQVFRWNAETGGLSIVQVASTLPARDAGAPAAGQSQAAEIAISQDGRSLYASNRGHDSIAHFAVDQKTGLLGLAQCMSCQGHEPRFFDLAPDGRTLHVANQESDNIISFYLNEKGGLGTATLSASVGSPSSICFAASPRN